MIQPAEPQDGTGIVAVARRAGNFTAEEVTCVDELWQENQKLGPEASGYYFLVDRDAGRVRGFTCYGPHPLTLGTYDLYWIAVDPDFRQHGVGRELLAASEQAVAALGGRILIAETSGKPEYTPTRQFYLRCGYQAEATLREFYGPGDDLVFFTRHLA